MDIEPIHLYFNLLAHQRLSPRANEILALIKQTISAEDWAKIWSIRIANSNFEFPEYPGKRYFVTFRDREKREDFLPNNSAYYLVESPSESSELRVFIEQIQSKIKKK